MSETPPVPAPTDARVAQLVDSVRTDLFIGGEWIAASGVRRFDVLDPSTGELLTQVADASARDGAAALDAAHAAQPEWARTAPRTRSEILRRGFELLIERREDLALLMTLEMGKPLAESRGEVTYGAEFLRWFAEEAPRISGRYSVAPDGGNRHLVLKRPVGPALLITPWNFPLAMATRKVGPALAAGCTAILKPAELTPLTALLFAEIMAEAGVPAGVLNVVPTTDPGALVEPLLRDGRLRKLSFTGSTAVGRTLLAQSADQVLRVSLELGGNAPFVVFGDADLDAAVDGAMVAKLRNGGETCVAANRFLVHDSVAEEFATRLTARMSAVVVGRGTEPETTLGPLIDEKAVAKVDQLVSGAAVAGAEVLLGGSRTGGPGYFYPPTVLTNVATDAEILRSEVFGPVAPIVTFTDEEEAIRLANATPYGLIAYVFTADTNRLLRMAERLETGMLAANTGLISNPAAPFGGVKQSGLGREGGAEGIEEYLETVFVGLPNPDDA